MTARPLIITLGDPGGLGPEIVSRLLSENGAAPGAPRIIIGPESALEWCLETFDLPKFWTRMEPERAGEAFDGIMLLEPDGLDDFQPTPGTPSVAGGRAAGLALETACSLLEAGKARGLVTCPLNKAMLQEAGFDFPGHTEFLAERLGPGRGGVCMHLAGERLRVSLVTTHPPLSEVPKLVTRERVLRCLELTWDLMLRQGLTDSPIAVCGLNPHAGESGKIGSEDSEIIAPAIEAARSKGIDATGPLPADTVFHFAAAGRYSSVLAMYHDQGLPPLKLLHFGEAVNITLGLPYVRTSPDHGTGYDLVGTGKAGVSSMKDAISTALILG
jgi:4-hydroxythreonine-4-phosphate dehydrogenase